MEFKSGSETNYACIGTSQIVGASRRKSQAYHHILFQQYFEDSNTLSSYNDEIMKRVFQLIVERYSGLHDT
jgi:hypothetical protein